MAIIGRKPSTGYGVGVCPGGQTKANIMGALTSPGWVTEIGWNGGNAFSGDVSFAKACAWTVHGPQNIGDLWLAQPMQTVRNHMYNGQSGTAYRTAVTGKKYDPQLELALGIFCDGGTAAFEQDHSGRLMYRDNGRPEPATFVENSVSPEGKMGVWLNVEPNRAPHRPTITQPASNGIVSTQTPDITVGFSDPDEGYGDSFSGVLIEVIDYATGVRVSWTGGIITAGISGNSVTWTVPDTLPAATYRIRATTYDAHGYASPSAESLFTVNAGGAFVDVTPSPPIGTRNGVNIYNGNPASITATWTHDNGEDAEEIEWRIVNASTGAEVRPWANVVATFGVGDPVQVNWSWASLTAGPDIYKWEIRGLDALGSWSPASQSPPFQVNAAPTVAISAPADGVARTTRPEVRVQVGDTTDTASALAVQLYISVDDVLTAAHAMSYAGGNEFSYQLTSADVAGYGDVTLDATVVDPWGLSANATPVEYAYVAPPTVTLVTVTYGATIETAAPTIGYTVDRAQTKRRITLSVDGQGGTAYDSGWVVTANTAPAIPAGELRNETTYSGALEVETADGLTATVPLLFTVSYPAPAAPGNPIATPEAASVFDTGAGGLAEQKPNVRVSWDRVPEATAPPAQWLGQFVTATTASGESYTWEIPSREQTSIIDNRLPAGTVVTYTITYLMTVNAGMDIVRSDPAEVTASVDILYPVITSGNGDDTAVTLHWWDEDRTVEPELSQRVIRSGWTEKAIIFQGRLYNRRIDGTAYARHAPGNAPPYLAGDVMAALEELSRPAIGSDGASIPRVVWWRDPRGLVMRCVIRALPATVLPIGTYAVELELEEVGE